MANEIQAHYATGATTLYAVILSPVGTVWDTTSSTLVALSGATWANLDVAMAEVGSTGLYFATFPAGITVPGNYTTLLYNRLGGSPAASDTLVDSAVVEWSGAAVGKPQSGDAYAAVAALAADWTGALADDLTTFLGGTGPTTADLAAAIWSALLSGSAFSTSGGVGTALKAFLAASPVPLSDIAAAVWADAPAGVPLSDIRDEVWSALFSGSAFTGSGKVGTELKALLTAPDVPMSDFKAEVVAALATDTYAETSGVPGATSSLAAKLGWLFKLSRNKAKTTASGIAIRNDADSADSATTTHSDDGTTYTRNEWS